MKSTPCRTLTVSAAPGTERWSITPAEARTISCWLSRDLKVYFWPRASVRQVWAQTHHGAALPTGTCSFRAWSSGCTAHIFVDDTETRDSVKWLLLHELAHLDLVSAPLLTRAYRGIPRPSDYLHNDAAHEGYPEEQMANLVADQLAPKLGGKAGLNRTWWRARIFARRQAAR